MSEVSELIQRRQQQIDSATESTKQAVQSASAQIEQCISEGLSNVEKDCKSAMEAHKKRVRRQIKMTWLPLWLCSLATIGALGGVIYWQMNMIVDQREALAQYKEQGSEIQTNYCKTESGDRRLCVKIDLSADRWGKKREWMIPEGY